MITDAWDPAQYNRFADEREQPFWDLAALLHSVRAPVLADLGCGDGRLTAALHEHLGAANSHGVDSSRAMINDAAAHATDDVTFALGDIGTWGQPETYDIVFANAALQWVPDHPTVLGRWIRSLKPGGQIAVQVPSNADQATHRIAAELGAELLADPPPDPVANNVLAPEVYARVLDDLGCVDQQVRLQVYAHHLATTSDAVEWVKGTMLTRFKEPLGPDRWNEFVERFRERYVAEMGARSPYFFPFKRVLLWGRIA
jgi:trans-aconitate 2-methyltransferase